jgi:hypothetical protein
MDVYEIDPTRDERWDGFLQEHSEASIFHTGGWLEALRHTYGYEPVALTTSPPGCPLTSAVPFCRISNWLSGRRLVSLPFSDHCAPLVETSEQLAGLLTYLRGKVDREKWRYVEIRPSGTRLQTCLDFRESGTFVSHKLDLRPSLDAIFHAFHKDCVHRKIQRAEREGLTCQEGRSELLVAKFYHLLLMTRRRHGVPPQPIQWFRNVIAFLGDEAKIRMASKDGRPVASIVTLRHRNTLVYKYGCSDQRFNKWGGTQLLLWNAIQEAKNDDLSEFDMGRSDCENPGLAVFKDRWGAARTPLVYFRYPMRDVYTVSKELQSTIGKYLWSHMPNRVLGEVGRVLYRYMG